MPSDTIASPIAAPPHPLRLVVSRLAMSRLADIAGSRVVGLFFKFGISAGLIALVCRHIDGTTLVHALSDQAPAWIAATALIGVVQIALLTVRWQQILKALGGENGLLSALAVTYMGFFFGAFLFGQTGSDVARAVLAPPRRLGRTGIVHSVLFERLASLAGVGLAVVPLVFVTSGPVPRGLPLLFALAVVPLPFLAMAAAGWLARGFGQRGGALFGALREFDRSRQTLCRAWPRFALAVALAAAGQVLVAAEAWCLARSLHLGVRLLDLAMLMPPVMLVIALPISAGGWGVREGAMVTALALVGIGSVPALLLSVELGLITMLVSLPGGAIWLHRWLSRPGAEAGDVA